MVDLRTMSKSQKYHLGAEQLSTELEQVKAAQTDPRSFEPLYAAYYSRLVGFIYQRLDNKEEAFEITAQVFYIALSQLPKFRSQGVPFGAWLFRIASNEL